MSVPWEAVSSVAAIMGIAVGVWGLTQAHHAQEREKAAMAAAEEAKLAATEWTLHAELRPRAGLLWDFPPQEPPILLYLSGANVWLHEVVLSWGFASERGWVLENGRCEPADEGVLLPRLIYSGDRKLRLSWPGAPPNRQEQLRCELRACCSLTKDGPEYWRDVRVSGVNWQGG